MNSKLSIVLILLCFALPAALQAQLEVNGALDMMLSKGGEDSHFFYNSIHKDRTDWRAGVFMLSGNLAYQKDRIGLAFGFFLERENDNDFGQFIIRELQLSVRMGKDQHSRLVVGRFVTPYGSHVEKQYQSERYFIDRPLFYNYYLNVSDQIGLLQDLGNKNPVSIAGEAEWGITNVYYHGYSTGLLYERAIREEKDQLALAITTAPPAIREFFNDTRQISVIARYKMRLNHYWEPSFFISYGNFITESPATEILPSLDSYSQTLAGVSIRYSKGFFSSLLEFNTAWYKTPEFSVSDGNYILDSQGDVFVSDVMLSALSVDLAYEPPFLSGAFVAYRFDWLNGPTYSFAAIPWEARVIRNSFAAGYKINTWSTAKVVATLQDIANHNWDLNTFKLLLTAYY